MSDIKMSLIVVVKDDGPNLKALPDMAGLYQLMHNEVLAREAANFEYVNMRSLST